MRGARTPHGEIRCIGPARAFTIRLVRSLLLAAAACSCNHVSLPAPPPAPAAAAATALAVPASEPRPFAVPDETMEFRAGFRGIHVGVVQTAIGRPGWIDNHHAIIVRSHGHSDGLVSMLGEIAWDLSTTIDLDAGHPIENREQAQISLAGQHEHHDNHHTWSTGDQRHDIHSVIGMLRGWQSRGSERMSAEVELGGGRFVVDVWNAGREYLPGPAKPAVRYDGKVHQFPFAIWISDDAARVPLRFQTDTPVGSVVVELTDYQVRGE
jgi:hypothetical protein